MLERSRMQCVSTPHFYAVKSASDDFKSEVVITHRLSAVKHEEIMLECSRTVA